MKVRIDSISHDPKTGKLAIAVTPPKDSGYGPQVFEQTLVGRSDGMIELRHLAAQLEEAAMKAYNLNHALMGVAAPGAAA